VGLSFAEALRSFLRQDPDVVMVGEIRDIETAEIGIKAAQTGHLVLSTLHTNSAAETLTRLLNMGVPTFNVATGAMPWGLPRLQKRKALTIYEYQLSEKSQWAWLAWKKRIGLLKINQKELYDYGNSTTVCIYI